MGRIDEGFEFKTVVAVVVNVDEEGKICRRGEGREIGFQDRWFQGVVCGLCEVLNFFVWVQVLIFRKAYS